MNILETKNLIKSFHDGDRETRVLKNISISFKEKEFAAITGKSGSGKSTFIYQLGLLDIPTDGEVYLLGEATKALSEKKRTEYRLNNYGFVFQNYALMPDLCAWENVAIPMMMRGMPAEEARKIAYETIDAIGLVGKEENYPNQLSGGEAQRVSIGRAIAHKPKILFADEPTANLDSDRSRQIIDLFHTLHKQGQTIIMVTHELEYAKECSRLIEIRDGIILSDTAKA
ncbi:MAG: ABC transporter ATP-binding protein [Alphaproteobacteria bacterium]|nr:ABC transporter ATP-binding protein [Alphaproteobacteria bacterium]